MTNLIIAGIYLTAFFVSSSFGHRETQLLMSSVMMLLFFAKFIFDGGVVVLRNKWLLAFIAFIPISIFFAPTITIPLFGKSQYFWFPEFCILAHFLGFVALSNTILETDAIIRHIRFAAFLMACYVILQSLGIDQFFVRLTEHPKAVSTSPWLYGTLGNSRMAGAYLALCLPVFGLKDWRAGIVLTALLLINSKLAFLGVFVGLWCRFLPKRLIMGSVILLLSIIAYYSWRLPDSARLATYQQIWSAFIAGLKPNGVQYCITGYGIGSFPYLFAYPNGRIWLQAHNEYLEILWSFGVIGFTFFILALKHEIQNLKKIQPFFSMFCVSLVMAAGFFTWQCGAIAFLTVLALVVISEAKTV